MGKDDMAGTKRDDSGMPIPAEDIEEVRNGRDEGGGKKQDQGRF
jgi:hypothetical protein